MLTASFKPESVSDVLHGVRIEDPYRWLEDRTSPRTQNWIDEKRGIHDAYFARLSTLAAIRNRVRTYLNAESVDQPTRAGNTLFFRRRKADQQQSSILALDEKRGVERTLVDPAAYGPIAAVAIHRISENGELMAYSLKHGGERSEQLHVIDVRAGRPLGCSLPRGILRGLAFSSDNRGFYYCLEPIPSPASEIAHAIRDRRFDGRDDGDEIVFSASRTGRSRLILSSDRTHFGVALLRENGSEIRLDFYRASRREPLRWKQILGDRKLPCSPFLHQGQIYLISFSDHPHGQILRVREDGSDDAILVPPWKAPICGLHPAGERLYVFYQIDSRRVVHAWSWSGEFLNSLPEHPGGTFDPLPSYADSDEALFFVHESFSKSPSLFEYHAPTRSYLPLAVQNARFEERDWHTERVTYPSGDGTRIPMWLVSLNRAQERTQRPAILTGYGGFGISMTPRFSVLVAVLVRLGFVFALPNIRGGSEFGREWYEAARRRNRQTAFDDFLAAAEWLSAVGIADPSRLAIFGGSNSGLLVAAAMTQRPGLFRAVLCIAPLLDMLRYEQFDDARKWREEYGTIEDAEDFRALHAYSPYHRVRDDVNYPATLFVTGDNDTECNPAHTRKMAALVGQRPAQNRPVLVDYSRERGHSACLPLDVRVEALSRRIAFLCNELNVPVPPEVSS